MGAEPPFIRRASGRRASELKMSAAELARQINVR